MPNDFRSGDDVTLDLIGQVHDAYRGPSMASRDTVVELNATIATEQNRVRFVCVPEHQLETFRLTIGVFESLGCYKRHD
jgi:hypothetical protein